MSSQGSSSQEKELCGCKYSTLAKIANMGLGILMVFYSVITFFSIATAVFKESPILVIMFKVYEM